MSREASIVGLLSNNLHVDGGVTFEALAHPMNGFEILI